MQTHPYTSLLSVVESTILGKQVLSEWWVALMKWVQDTLTEVSKDNAGEGRCMKDFVSNK